MRSPLPVVLLALVACHGPASRTHVADSDLCRFNLPLTTLGGLQVWGDVRWFHGWRVQENVLTGHFRLLDPQNVRRAWGSRAACLRALAARTEGIAAQEEHLVLLLHGLGRSRTSMTKLAGALEDAGYRAAALAYPSTRGSIEEHAERLEELLNGLPDFQRVSFVGHSLGGLVWRRVLGSESAWKQRLEAGRLVMLAPPNRGSILARTLKELPGFATLAGRAGVQASYALELRPVVPFGIVTAGRGDGYGWNPLIPGDDDGFVGVYETFLPGAEDMMHVIGLHTFVMKDPDVIEGVVHYLNGGTFQQP